MARTFLTNIDLAQNELQNAVIQNLASAPSNPVEGQVYVNTVTHVQYQYLNGTWVTSVDAAKLGVASRCSNFKFVC